MINKNILAALSIFLLLISSSPVFAAEPVFGDDHNGTPKLVLFHLETCPHCHKEREWLETIRSKYPELVIEEYEASENVALFQKYAKEYNTTTSGVPRTFVSEKVFAGFIEGDGDLVYNEGYQAYMGYQNQIEKAILDCYEACGLTKFDLAIEASKKDPLVVSLLAMSPNSSTSSAWIDEMYVIAWWTPQRLESNLDYPNIVVYVEPINNSISRSIEPSQRIDGLQKPISRFDLFAVGYMVMTDGLNMVFFAILGIYLLVYLFLEKRLGIDSRIWAAGFIALALVTAYLVFSSLPTTVIEKFAKGFPFPVFVFIIALADGFNPCAFTVLAVLLSLLTHTKSRKKMALVGSVFILTSAFMYFLFISAINYFGTWIFSQWGQILFMFLGAIIFIAGVINLKDYFFFKKGLSLSIPDGQREKIFKQAGRIVRKVDSADSKTALLAALLGTVILAALVNVVELGCTAVFPMAYTSALLSRYGSEIGLVHIAYTSFYSLVYVIPLFVILMNFIYTFKSERVTEGQARILKLGGGLLMIALGLILLLKPDLLLFMR